MEIKYKILIVTLGVVITGAATQSWSGGIVYPHANKDVAAGISSMSPEQANELILNMGNDKVFELIRRLDTDALARVFRSVDPYRLAQMTKLMAERGAERGAIAQIAARCPPDNVAQSEYPLIGNFSAQQADLGAYTVIVNPVNPISELSVNDVKKLFDGEYTNWKQLNGPDQPVEVVVMRDTEPLLSSILKSPVAKNAVRPIFMSEIMPLVATNPGAIALVSRGRDYQIRFITSQSSVKKLTLLNEAPEQKITVAGKPDCDRLAKLCANY
jgi:hypothetical protein